MADRNQMYVDRPGTFYFFDFSRRVAAACYLTYGEFV